MTIRENILAVQARAEQDPTFATTIKNQAIAAIYNGISDQDGSPWVTYMQNFVDSPATATSTTQLARLTTTADDPNNPYLEEARAYLVGNAVCFPGTTTTTVQGVTNLLDQ